MKFVLQLNLRFIGLLHRIEDRHTEDTRFKMSLAHKEKDDILAQEGAFDVKPTLSQDEYAPVGRENLRTYRVDR